MNQLELDSNNKDKPRFIVVIDSSVTSTDLLLKNNEYGNRFNMWLEAAGLLGYDFAITQAATRSTSPVAAFSLEDQTNALDNLNVELQPFKRVICLGPAALAVINKLEFVDKEILALPHPTTLGNPKEAQQVISSLRLFKSKL